MNIIHEALEAAATQDVCGNHNSADLLRRLACKVQADRIVADALAKCLREAVSSIDVWSPAMVALDTHAKRREAGE